MGYLGTYFGGLTGGGGTVLVTPSVAPDRLAVTYCSDEEVALRAPLDYKALAPPWQTLAAGTDGAFAAGSRWVLTSAAVDFQAAGVQSGNVVILSASAINLNDALFAVDHAATGALTLRRLGQPAGVGTPPGPAAGAAGVKFDVRTFARLIDDASYDANAVFGIDPALPGRSPADLEDVRELRQYTALSVLRRAYIAASEEKGDDYALKLDALTAELAALRDRLQVHWGQQGQGDSPANVFGGRRRR